MSTALSTSAATSTDPLINVSAGSDPWPSYPLSAEDNHLRWINWVMHEPIPKRSRKKIDERKMRRLMWRKKK